MAVASDFVTRNYSTEKLEDHDIFIAAARNEYKKLKELLDCGVDINLRDFDKGQT